MSLALGHLAGKVAQGRHSEEQINTRRQHVDEVYELVQPEHATTDAEGKARRRPSSPPGSFRWIRGQRELAATAALATSCMSASAAAMVLGRRNHFGSKSVRGTEMAAIFYSLVETAKVCGIDPIAYLVEVATRARRTSGAVLLPADFKASLAAA